MPPIAPQSGYKYAAQVTVTGGGAAVNGSTLTPTGSSSDYVVCLHLTGSDASTVYSALTSPPGSVVDSSASADLGVFYWDGTQWNQIDCDIDQVTNGLWSTSNITLWFKLQAALSASPATDGNYMICFGKTGTITAKNNWSNLYPLADDFLGTTLSSTWASSMSSKGSFSVSGSVLTLTSGTGIAFSYIDTTSLTYGAGYRADLYSLTGASTAGNALVGQRNGSSAASSTSPNYMIGVVSGTSTSSDVAQYSNGTAATTVTSYAIDNTNYHVYSVARDASGTAYYGRDMGTSALTSSTVGADTNAQNIDFLINGNSSTSNTLSTDWVKVRPWITTEPTTALGSIVSGAAWVNSAAATASMSYAITRSASYLRPIASIVSTVTGAARSMTMARTRALAAVLTGAASRLSAYKRSAIATASTAQSVSHALTHLRSVARTTSVVASATRTATYTRATAATTQAVRAVSHTLTHLRSVSRTAAILSVSTRNVAYKRAQAKVVSWATDASNTLTSAGHTAWDVAATATLSLSTSVTRQMGITRSALRTVSASANSVRVMTMNKASSATTSIRSGVSRYAGYVVYVARSASLSASTARTMALSRAATATGGVVGLASRQMTLARVTISQAAIQGHLFFDGLSANFHDWTRYTSATISTSTSVTRLVGMQRAVSATVQTAMATSYKKALAMVRALYQVAARVFSLTAAPRVTSFTVASRNFSFTATGTPMPATPDTNGKNFIASTEKNVSFSCNFSKWLEENETIDAATITMSAVMTNNPSQDMSANAAALLQGYSIASPVVTVDLGNANATVGAAYTVRIDVTTNQGRDYAETIGPIYCTY